MADVKWTGGPWPKGYSPNPAGRPPGAQSTGPVAYARRAIRDAMIPIINKVIEKAENGDTEMIKLLVSQVDLRIKEPIFIDVNQTSEHILNRALEQYAEGDMADSTMTTINQTIKTRIDAVDVRKINERIDKIEEASQNDNGQDTQTPGI